MGSSEGAARKSEGVAPNDPAGAGVARLLSSSDPGEVRARIAEGDPLGLYGLGVSLLRQRSFMIDPERLFERSLAFVALTAVTKPEGRGTASWLESVVNQAIDSLLAKDQEENRRASLEPSPHHSFVAEAFGVEHGSALHAAVTFNHLPEQARRTFYALFVEERTVSECIESGLGPAEHLRDNARLTLRALGHLDDWELRSSGRRVQP